MIEQEWLRSDEPAAMLRHLTVGDDGSGQWVPRPCWVVDLLLNKK